MATKKSFPGMKKEVGVSKKAMADDDMDDMVPQPAGVPSAKQEKASGLKKPITSIAQIEQAAKKLGGKRK